jgi:hypothetical protein
VEECAHARTTLRLGAEMSIPQNFGTPLGRVGLVVPVSLPPTCFTRELHAILLLKYFRIFCLIMISASAPYV